MSRRLLVVLLTALLPAVLLGTVIRVEMNSAGLYQRGFETYAIEQVTGISG